MLQRRIDLGSIPYGLAVAGEDIVKGSAVVTKFDNGVLKAFYPTTQAEADAVKGFATYRIEDVIGNDKDYDVIKAGQRLVIYTLVKDNMWATTQFVAPVNQGDELVVGFDADDKGKLRTKTAGELSANRASQFKVYNVSNAGEGYTDAMIDVEVL